MQFSIMDRSGHKVEVFDQASKVSMEEAEKRFKELTGSGFAAGKRGEGGKSDLVRGFDPAAEEIVFVPPLQGG